MWCKSGWFCCENQGAFSGDNQDEFGKENRLMRELMLVCEGNAT